MHRDYVKPGRLPVDMGRMLSTLSDLRSIGDYGGAAHVSHAEATVAMREAQQLLRPSIHCSPQMSSRWLPIVKQCLIRVSRSARRTQGYMPKGVVAGRNRERKGGYELFDQTARLVANNIENCGVILHASLPAW